MSADQIYRAGEAHGRLEERKNQMMGSAAKDKAQETAHAAVDKTRETKDRLSGGYISEKAGAATQKAYEAAEAAREKTSQTAQGAKDAVKHTFGMADYEEEDDPICKDRA